MGDDCKMRKEGFKEVPIMVRGLLLSVAVLLLLTSCKTGPLRDIRLGKTFAVLAPDEIAIHMRPVRGSETSHLEEPETFIVEDVMCDGGGYHLVLGRPCWYD